MKKLLKYILGLVLVLTPSLVKAQAPFVTGNISTSAANCGTAAACVSLGLARNSGGASFTITGNYSGTLQFEASADGGNFSSLSVTPSAGTSAVTSTTGTGLWSANVSAFNVVRVRASSLASGGVTVTIQGSMASAQIPGSGSSTTSMGPVINAAAYGISTSGDNVTAFTSASTAANSFTATITPNYPRTAPATIQTSGTETATINLAGTAGDTVYVWIADSFGYAFTITTDLGGTTFTQVGTTAHNASSGYLQLYASPVGGAHNFNTLTVTESTATEIIAVSGVVLPGVSANVFGTATTGSSVTPLISQTTTAAGSNVLSACEYYNATNATTLSNATGTLLTNLAEGTTGQVGLAVWGTYEASIASAINSGTITNSSPWVCQSVEVQGGGTVPLGATLYIPQGYYNYSGGLSLQQPGEVLKCESGTTLNYTGSAHAIDVGVQGLVSDSPGGTKNRFIIDGCTFTGGANMTEGIYVQPYNQYFNLRFSNLINFGNSTAYMIDETCENWDSEIGPSNYIAVWDFQPRNVYIMNSSHCSANSFTRIHDNVIFCVPGPSANQGCSVTQAGIGFVLDGDENRFYHNNIAFFLPNVKVLCNNAPSGSTCFGNQVDQNQMEAPAVGTTSIGQIQYSNQNGMLVTQNVMVMQATGASPMTPVGGSDVITGARINFNTVMQIALATPFIVMNNVTGQNGNFSYSNECGTALTTVLPCAFMHTTGSNIGQFNADNYPVLTFASGTTASYSFLTTYNTAPHCTIPPNITGTATTLTITTLNTTTLTITASGSNSATVYANCSGSGDGQ